MQRTCPLLIRILSPSTASTAILSLPVRIAMRVTGSATSFRCRCRPRAFIPSVTVRRWPSPGQGRLSTSLRECC
jgi:hypothetical protein